MDRGAPGALSLGGNQGDVRGAFRYAFDRLAATSGVELIAKSSLWRTPPWGKTDQADFLNMAALVRTTLTPRALLALCLQIEAERDRQRDIRWGPRTLDIDIIAFDDLAIEEPDLIIPHPHAHERAFVLAPLAEIAPDLELSGRRIADWLAIVGSAGERSIGPLDP